MGIDRIVRLIEAGNDACACSELLELVDLQPSAEGAWLLLVGIGFRSNDIQLALRAFRALEKLRFGDAFVASGLVDCLMQLEMYEEVSGVVDRFSKVARPGNDVHETVLHEHRQALQEIERMSRGR